MNARTKVLLLSANLAVTKANGIKSIPLGSRSISTASRSRALPEATATPAPVSGNSAASTADTTDPWANISY